MKTRWICFVLQITVTGALCQAATTYDAAADFSIASNPNSVWAYGSNTGLGTAFVAFNQAADGATFDGWSDSVLQYPYVLKNMSASTYTNGNGWFVPAGALTWHPANGSGYGVLLLAPANLTGFGTQVQTDFVRTLQAGDVISFLLGNQGNTNQGDSTGFNVTVTFDGGAVPEPSTYLFVTCALLLFAAQRKR